MNKHTLGIGLLLVLLATACSPQMQKKNNAKGSESSAAAAGAKGATAKTAEGLMKIAVNTSDEDGAKADAEAADASSRKSQDELLTNLLKDQNLLDAIAAYEKDYQVDCLQPRKNQIRSQCQEDSTCELSLDLTCVSRITTKQDVQAMVAAATSAAAAISGGAAAVIAVESAKRANEEIERGDLYRLTVYGTLDYAKAVGQWNLEKVTTKHIQVKSEDWKTVE